MSDRTRQIASVNLDTTQVQLLRPLFPTTPEDTQRVVLSYFNYCQSKNKHPTFSGLASSLGITREELVKFVHDNPNIHHIIQKAKQIVVDNVEQLIFQGNPPGGLAFWLKNNDNWVEKYEYQHTEKKISDLLNELEREGKLIKGEVIE